MGLRIVIDEDKRIGEWVYARTGGTFVGAVSRCIGLERNGELVTGVVYEGWNGSSVKVHTAIENKAYLTREFLRVVFCYPFDQLKAKKLIGLVDSTNAAALNFDTHLGFVEEHRIKDAGHTGDMVIFTMTREQCRFIRTPDAQRLHPKVAIPAA